MMPPPAARCKAQTAPRRTYTRAHTHTRGKPGQQQQAAGLFRAPDTQEGGDAGLRLCTFFLRFPRRRPSAHSPHTSHTPTRQPSPAQPIHERAHTTMRPLIQRAPVPSHALHHTQETPSFFLLHPPSVNHV